VKKRFKFVYSFIDGEAPDELYLKANNITNAKIEWEAAKKKNDTLLAIFCDDEEIWRNENIKTGYLL